MQVKHRFPVPQYLLVGLIVTLSILLIGCEYNKPSPVYNDNTTFATDPVIQSVDPPDSAIAGVDLVTIHGQNFSDSLAGNAVYFNGVPATVMSSSTTQLVVSIPPDPKVAGDASKILVDVDGSLQFGKFTYTVRLAVKPVVTDFSPGDGLLGFTMNPQLDYLASTSNVVIKQFDQSGGLTNTYPWLSATVFTPAKNIVYGPDGRIYTGGKYGRPYNIYAIDASPDTTIVTTLNTVSSQPKDFDFDQNGNLWVASQNSIGEIRGPSSSTPTYTELVSYTDMELIALRYFEDRLYLLSKTNAGQYSVWEADTTAGNATEIANLNSAFGDTVEAFDIDMDNQGGIFVSTDFTNSLFYITPTDHTVETFYPGLVPTPLNALNWKEKTYLLAGYIDPKTGDPAIYQIDTKTLTMAPRWGRQ